MSPSQTCRLTLPTVDTGLLNIPAFIGIQKDSSNWVFRDRGFIRQGSLPIPPARTPGFFPLGPSAYDMRFWIKPKPYTYLGDGQNYGPFLGPFYNTGPNLGDPKRDHNFDNPPPGTHSLSARTCVPCMVQGDASPQATIYFHCWFAMVSWLRSIMWHPKGSCMEAFGQWLQNPSKNPRCPDVPLPMFP